MTQTVRLSDSYYPISSAAILPSDVVCLRSLNAIREKKAIHAVYLSTGASQESAYYRLIALHGIGITNLAKVSIEDRELQELMKKYEAADQTIIVFSADLKELARFSPSNSEADFRAWIALESSRKQVAQK